MPRLEALAGFVSPVASYSLASAGCEDSNLCAQGMAWMGLPGHRLAVALRRQLFTWAPSSLPHSLPSTPCQALLTEQRTNCACRRLDNYAYLVKKYCGDAERNTCGPDADLDTFRQQTPLTVSTILQVGLT